MIISSFKINFIKEKTWNLILILKINLLLVAHRYHAEIKIDFLHVQHWIKHQ